MFYQSIARVYDHIFPQNKEQLNFIKALRTINKDEHLLDIGCATGNLTELLVSQSNHVTGLDLDHELLEVAKEKHPTFTFVQKNMLKIDDLFQESSLDRIISFGNTLVHLPDRQMVQDFFSVAYKTLKPGGLLIIQIINYDRIIGDKVDHLATIDNDQIRFVRHYKVSDDSKTVSFDTDLSIKSNGQSITNSIDLLTLGREELESMLTAAGFSKISFFGNLKGDPLTPTSIPLLLSCSK